ncbi:hydrogenase 4 subunit H [Shimwellia blattae]|uniref:Hydrogenase-4 component H n=1 Tax=Shimwellia blattae (strain ATCC 29907 / DSM 4481 / JCM 1650 / NBRC 105725 / CDC 9005-74) TaxID=630626 RepID=I2BDB1_SHIBC|nr:hydrogenase 4 subunit H [Shimwellia blattae]AFJ48515.1 hydrogenase-4 component H [Shimwellia blattae DSM 4481 = NBRC 105725]GAB83109.1 NiFe-hydrogenase 4 component H [Shimwellia blattae DSM 4481 = NBRC 105725]VDY66007.1 NADH-quinone oxidoreductase subunit I [Shimwellia blattae]VEC26620.1 NADH-quinone oxidoreductase subunit I [Shimwellia blattae]
MLKLLKTIRDAGVATVKYPFKPLEVCADFRGKPEYDPQQCIACGACTVACPANALTMETHPEDGTRTWQLFLGRCIFCGRCEEVCPTRAIVLSPDFELAVTNKPDLYNRATFSLLECRECHQPFTAGKALEYAMALLVQSGIDEATVEEMRPQFETCPTCKQRQNLFNNGSTNLSYHVGERK